MTPVNKKKLDIIIVEDEIKALNYLKFLVQECLEDHAFFSINNIITFNNAYDALDFLKNNPTHLAFLDINMPGKTGIELSEDIKKIKNDNKTHFPITCFTTAYGHYALKAFENDVFDYIMKPIVREQLDKFFDKLSKTISFENDGKYLQINVNGAIQKIKVEDILYITADGKYINICTPVKKHLITDSLYSFENKYNNFIKIHRSYLVNKSYIKSIFQRDNQLFIKLKDLDMELPVSRRNRPDVEKELGYFINNT